MLIKRFWLPYPRCTGNNMYGRNGYRSFKTDVYKDYINQCYYYLLTTKKIFNQIMKPVTLSLRVFYIPRTNVTKDDDNLLKVLKDTMKHCKLIQDDSQIINTHIKRLPVDRDNPRVFIEITNYDINDSVIEFSQIENYNDLTPAEFMKNEEAKT